MLNKRFYQSLLIISIILFIASLIIFLFGTKTTGGILLLFGFMVLAFSGYNMNADMGLMSALTISLALILDFLFLPTLLMKVEGKKHELLYKETDATTIDRYGSVLAPASVGSSGRDA